MTRRWVRVVVQGLVGVLLFAQIAVAAYACPSRAPAEAAAPQMAATNSTQMSNCGDMAGAMDTASANLCAEHCKFGQQSDHAPTLNVPVAVLTALYASPLVGLAPPSRAAAASMSARVAASPPHAILHCVFRI